VDYKNCFFQSVEDGGSIDVFSLISPIEPIPTLPMASLFSDSFDGAFVELVQPYALLAPQSASISGLPTSGPAAQLLQIFAPLYEPALTKYPGFAANLVRIVNNFPELNFSNPLTIDLGNTLADHSFNQLVIFGDSLSDTGNLFNALGGTYPASPPYFNGRFSNGPLWLEYLAPQLGINQVTNFAYGGSTTGRTNNSSQTVGQNVDNLPGVLTQVDLFTSQLAASGSPLANPNALYVIWGGANDFLAMPTGPVAAIRSVITSVDNVAQAVIKLAGVGAKTILVPNIPNLSQAPSVIARNLTTQATIFSTLFDTLLQGTLGSLETRLGVDIIQVDVLSLSVAIAQRPSEFGFTNTTTSLFQQLASQPTEPVNANAFVFSDSLHPTTAVHHLISDEMVRSLSTATPGRVLSSSSQLVQELANSSGFRSLIGASSNTTSAGLLPTNGSIALTSGLLPSI
jgi:phospholipase/lecithinase/hemolysin